MTDRKAPPKPPEPNPSSWQGEVGGETQKVRRERGVVDPADISPDEDDD